MRITNMNNARQMTLTSQLEVGTKDIPLHITWREHTKVIEPKLSDGHNLRLATHYAELLAHLICIRGSFMWMHAHACKDSAGVCFCQCQGIPTRRKIAARINDARYTTCNGSLNDLFAIACKTGSINVCVAINKHYSILCVLKTTTSSHYSTHGKDARGTGQFEVTQICPLF